MHAAQETLSPTPQPGVALPANILGENTRRVEPRTSAEMPQRR